jgi:glycosyltransferase involved in cell wall biosynthesis
VLIAPDLPRAPPDVGEEGSSRPGGTATGPLRLIFLSRLAPVKNLDFLLDILATVRCEVDLAIHGLKENEAYWQSCEERIAALPGNVRASYHGAVMPDDVPGTFAQYDLFAFPSRGENFGHVVLESLSVGTPVLVSDRTPWKGGESDALEVLPIERREP